MNTKSLDFSIVIPTYNRPQRLGQCLDSIAQLDYPSDRFEVIVVDDGSHMSLKPVVDKVRSKLATVQLIRQENAGPASARNIGAEAAKGEYIVFTDDDCQPSATWLTALSKAVEENPNALIGGHTINALSSNVFSSASQLLINYLYDYYNLAKNEATFFASNNFAVPRNLYQSLGGFDTNFPLAAGEDREFCDRWRYHRYPMHYAHEMQVYHFHSLNLARFWRQHFNYGRGAYCFHQIHSQRNKDKVKVEPFSFYARLITYPFKQSEPSSKIILSLLLFLSQAANAFGFFWERLVNAPTYVKDPQ